MTWSKTGLTGLRFARVVDMAAFRRIHATGVGGKKIAKALGVPLRTAQELMKGEHWQQNPEKVRRFNEQVGSTIEPETGIPTNADLTKHGGLFDPGEGNSRNKPKAVRDARAVLAKAGVAKDAVKEVLDRMTALEGAENAEPPAKLDTGVFLEMIEERLWRVLRAMDSTVIASATASDLVKLFAALSDRRSLLRGEPTQIVRQENRGSLERVGKLLLKEIERRGITIEGTASEVQH